MIGIVRSGDMLRPDEALNPGENTNGIKIVSLTSRLGSSRDPRAVTKQVEERFSVGYESLDRRLPENIGGIFVTPDFDFQKDIRGRAFAIVGHDGGDMEDGDYTRAETGLSNGLIRIHQEIIRGNGHKSLEAMRGLESYLEGLVHGGVDLSRLDEILDQVRTTKARVNPILRIPLFARNAPEDCERLLQAMNTSPAHIALYIGDNTRELVKATLLKFPGLYRSIPALADESLELAA